MHSGSQPSINFYSVYFIVNEMNKCSLLGHIHIILQNMHVHACMHAVDCFVTSYCRKSTEVLFNNSGSRYFVVLYINCHLYYN